MQRKAPSPPLPPPSPPLAVLYCEPAVSPVCLQVLKRTCRIVFVLDDTFPHMICLAIV